MLCLVSVYFFRHLIGFFLFLFLTVCTAMKAPMVMDSLPHLPEIIGKADLNKIHAELLKCLPSLPSIPDLDKVKNELMTALRSLDFSTLSGWNIMEHLTSCLHDKFSIVSYHIWFFSYVPKSLRILDYQKSIRLLTAITLLNTEGFERWKNGLSISFNSPTNYTVAFLRFLSRSYVLFISQQHMPSLSLSLATPFIHFAQNWLCWNCCTNCNFILSSCILLIHVQPFLLLPLLRLNNIDGSCYYCFLSSPVFPKIRVQKVSRFAVLSDGIFGHCAYNA